MSHVEGTAAYEHNGFIVLRGLVPITQAHEHRSSFERAIQGMAQELGVTADAYLSAVCRWRTPNPAVMAMASAVARRVRPHVQRLLSCEEPIVSRAGVVRKSVHAFRGTHGHQDAGYWHDHRKHPFEISAWIPLDDTDRERAALRVLPGSHLEPVSPPVDYLRSPFEDPADSWGTRGACLSMAAGDVVLFHPRLWHASTPLATGLRRALILRWRGPGHTHPLPQADQLPDRPPEFGIYTSGDHLRTALRILGDDATQEHLLDTVARALHEDRIDRLTRTGPARRSLERLLLYMRAGAAHHATDQIGMVWESVREDVIQPALELGSGGPG